MGVWHTYSTRQTLSELETDKSRGLSGAEAERRLARWGPNRLEEGRRQGLLLRFLGQMKDPMILVLLAAAALSLWASGGEDWLDAAIILVIVVVNACISISQEDSAEKALEALRKMSAPLAKVVRDGALQRLETDRLVPGDIIHLEAGDLVPADARILEAASLQADESAMTGESVPVSKGLLSALPEDTPLAERHNMVLASTVITRGRAVCVVTGTGMDTEVGRIAGLLLGEGEGQTPLQKKMAEISKTLSFVCLCVCAVMFGVGLLQGRPMLDMFLTAVSLAVAAIPEGLPAIVTIVLALGVARMARRRAIVKRLPAVETLGCAGVICSDKTGTLTHANPVVAQVVPFGGNKELEMLRLAACLEEHFPHSMANAVVQAARERDLAHEEMHSQVEYLVAHGIASTVDGRRVIIGSAHFVFEDEGCTVPPGEQAAFDTLPKQYSHLYLAVGGVLAAVICISDPLRAEAADAVAALHSLGVGKIVMLTGDSERTAAAIAAQVGVDEYRAEVLPEDKAHFVQAERSQGRTVVMIGDGVNDSPALSAANVGIAISDGAAIAREIADVTIRADSLEELVTLKAIANALQKRVGSNYRFVLGFNSALILLGALGILPPATSAMLHNLSTLGISLRSMTDLLEQKYSL